MSTDKVSELTSDELKELINQCVKSQLDEIIKEIEEVKKNLNEIFSKQNLSIDDELERSLIDGYKYLSDEHVKLENEFGGNDEI